MTSPLIIFCADPGNRRAPDTAYDAEVEALAALGGRFDLISYEALVDDNDAAKAVRRVEVHLTPATAMYRGWMLTPTQYEALHGALTARGVHLVNDPAAYRHCHHFPESYEAIAAHTPQSVWLPPGEVGTDRIMATLTTFGTRPVIVKDYVKSRKHEWAEACFIPSAADRPTVERVVGRFLALQGSDLAGGLVFREFVDLAPIGVHPKSGMSLTREFRCFFFDAELVLCAPYWEFGEYAGAAPPLEQFADVVKHVRSRFFTMDVAQRIGGDWLVIELGDGQVAGVPEGVEPRQLYEELLRRWP